jgi:hypothetical protein
MKKNILLRDKICGEGMRRIRLARGVNLSGHAMRETRLRLLARSGEPDLSAGQQRSLDHLDVALSQLGQHILDEPIPARLLKIVKKS